jgi:SAM-dependent methyltransferase
MTLEQTLANGIRTRLQAGRQAISRASLRAPWSREAMAIRLRNQTEMLAEYVRQGDSVLDVGCGTGYLCQYLDEMYGAEPTGLDVKDFRVAPIAFRTFDGTSIPFADEAFDHVVLCFTLHHSHDPMALIQECRRVARRSIIVFEDLPDSRFGKLKVSLHVEAFQRFYRIGTPRSAAYRSALAWLSDKTVTVVRTAMPQDWFDIFYNVPRFLLVYALPDH